MASLTGVGDIVHVRVPEKDTPINLNISGTYRMVLKLQKEVFKGSGVFTDVKVFDTDNATVSEVFNSSVKDERWRVIVDQDTSGTAVVTLSLDSPPVQSVIDRHVLKTVQGDYSFQSSDRGLLVIQTSSLASNHTIPSDINNSFPIGSQLDVVVVGSGTATVTAKAGTLLNGVDGGSTDISAQFAAVSILKYDDDSWVILGSISGVS